MAVKSQQAANVAAAQRIPLYWRLALSALLIFHVFAVFIAPFTFATTSGPGMSSPFAEPIRSACKPYIDFLYLDHGYFFFAPSPGPSHLVRARIEFADGRATRDLIYPDRNQQWPRLLYHRHFMLAEQLHGAFVPPQPPPGLSENPEQLSNWQWSRKLYELWRKSYEDHLRAEYGASHVTLTRVEHSLVPPSEFAARRKPINSADTFIDLSEDNVAPPIAVSRGGP